MLKNKKGIAIETAVFMMIIIFALCTLIVTITLYSRQHSIKANNDFINRVNLDKVGEKFIAALRNNDADSFAFDGKYSIISDGNERILTVYDDNGKVVLNVVAEPDGGNYIIKRWSCFEKASETPADQGE
ncbi:MAG: hypothetical protein J5530_06280 [Clostridia bacterium]|nr:hypothetical protein [Clostridia bacterium]